MVAWLRKHHWKHEVDSTGLPIVARAYRDKKLGISDDKAQNKYADTPNLQAFS
jgi:hypothetical protein